MPAPSHSLRLTAIAKRSIACLILVVLTLCAAGRSIAQAPIPQPRADQEPITPIPPPPAQDPRQVALGDRLFHDTRLSHDNTRSCNSCHDTSTNGASANDASAPSNSATDALKLSIPTVFNAALNFRLNWEGDLRTLEGQVEQSLGKPQIMGSSVEEALHKLQADSAVARQFREAYGREADGAALLDAIAAYERTLLTPRSRFDRWLRGDADAITAEEFGGYQLFKSLGCISCHQGVPSGNAKCAHSVARRGRLRGLPGGAEGIRTSDLRSVGAHALDGAAAGVDSSLRPECANSGRSPTAWRTGQIDPSAIVRDAKPTGADRIPR